MYYNCFSISWIIRKAHNSFLEKKDKKVVGWQQASGWLTYTENPNKKDIYVSGRKRLFSAGMKPLYSALHYYFKCLPLFLLPGCRAIKLMVKPRSSYCFGYLSIPLRNALYRCVFLHTPLYFYSLTFLLLIFRLHCKRFFQQDISQLSYKLPFGNLLALFYLPHVFHLILYPV